jgi:hypothetical protein
MSRMHSLLFNLRIDLRLLSLVGRRGCFQSLVRLEMNQSAKVKQFKLSRIHKMDELKPELAGDMKDPELVAVRT